MRFIGNKELIAADIKDLLKSKGLLDQGLTLFDAFSGTGAVADHLKDSLNTISNDLLTWCVIYSRGRIQSSKCRFEKLGLDPFEFLNSCEQIREGFIYKTYSPGASDRMYFSAENAGRIDFFRETIEDWKIKNVISEDECAHLLASLIESVSSVSNTAGVYGAFLKHWDVRATKPIIFKRVVSNSNDNLNANFLNGKVEDIIADVECDILYLDPPYTQNQYGTQYHLLETLVLSDEPSVSPVTGSRSTSPMRSDWSKNFQSHILFDKAIANTKAKHVVFSYSSDGFMSKSYIEAILKRYGKAETYSCSEINYNKYTNFKSRRKKDHFEYLFYVERKDSADVLFTSPLNYIGSKTRMLPTLLEQFPKDIDTFIDAFGGGFNVGINSQAKNIIYNDYNHIVSELIASFRQLDTYQFIMFVNRFIKKYGLEKENGQSYKLARDFYNSLPAKKRDPRILYAIIMYGFNQQIRFNKDFDFNNPVGQRWFNDKVLAKLISFSRQAKTKNIAFKSSDYSKLIQEISPKDFVYMDPPYRLTTGAYNDGKRGFKGWNERSELELFSFVDDLNKKSIRFMLSYVQEHKGVKNLQLERWVKSSGYKLIECNNIVGVTRKEVLIVNYDRNSLATLRNQEQISEERDNLSRTLKALNIG